MKTLASTLKLIACLAAVAVAAAIGGYATSLGLDEWYQALAKPSWNPPDWLFGPVWTLLYILMALAAWLVWLRGWKAAKHALALFLFQLILNAAWSWLFFGLRQPGWAFVEIVVLLAAIIATTVAFARIRLITAWLLTPYIVWVTFAGFLNFAIWRLNG